MYSRLALVSGVVAALSLGGCDALSNLSGPSGSTDDPPKGDTPDADAPTASGSTDAPEAATATEPAVAVDELPDLLALQAGGALVDSSGSHRESDYSPWLAIDDQGRSDWCGPMGKKTGQYVVVDRGVATSFTRFAVTLSASWAGETPTGVTIATAESPDGPWTDVGHVAIPQDAATGTVVPLVPGDPIQASAVRFTFDAPRSGAQVCVAGVHGHGTSPAQPMVEASGDWYTGWQFTTMSLRQDGAALEGCFDKTGGTVRGTVDGPVLLLDWKTTDARGRAALRVLPDGTGAGVTETWDADNARYTGSAYFTAKRADKPADCVPATPPTPEESPLEKDLADDGRARVYGILFDFGKATLRPESHAVLDEVAGILERHSDWSMTVEGHTDAIGSDASNQTLSERRAASVVRYLAGKGIATERLVAEGHGESQPVSSNDHALGRAQNRRVELVKR